MSLEPSTRRVNQRHTVSLPAVVTVEGQRRDVLIENISVGGLYLKDDHVYTNKQVITISFAIPNMENPIGVDAMVRWIERSKDRHEGIGVQFVGLKAKEVWALTRFISTLQSQEV